MARTFTAIAREAAVKCCKSGDPIEIESIIIDAIHESVLCRIDLALKTLEFYTKHDDNGQLAKTTLNLIK